MKFTNMNLPDFIVKGLINHGIENATEIQEKCISEIISGKDVIGQSQTGSGKTFAYGIPSLNLIDKQSNKIEVLIVCPTRELASQVCDELKKITYSTNIKIVPVFGGSDMTRQIIALKRANIVVGTPGRIMDHLRKKTLKLSNLKMVVLDEADEMLNMGFKEDIETILKDTPENKQMIMFSATMPKPILNLTKNFMKNPIFIKSNSGIENQNFVEQYFVKANRNQKNQAMLKLIKSLNLKTSLIFCNTKNMVDDLCEYLKDNGINAVCMHGDKRQSERKRILNGIKKDKEGILIGTDVLARGIDISDVNAVFNYDVPQNSEYYIHRIGRTARAGKDGKSFTIVTTANQIQQIKEIEKLTKNTIKEYKLSLDESDNFLNDYSSKNNFKKKSSNSAYKRKEGNSKYNKNNNNYNKKSYQNKRKNIGK